MRIVLPEYKTLSWNQFYAGCHWSVRQRMAYEAHSQVRCAVIESGAKMLEAPVEIEVVAHLKRRVDPDNLMAKILIDGLKGLVIPDDTPEHVLSVKTRVVKADRNFAEIIIREKQNHEQTK